MPLRLPSARLRTVQTRLLSFAVVIDELLVEGAGITLPGATHLDHKAAQHLAAAFADHAMGNHSTVEITLEIEDRRLAAMVGQPGAGAADQHTGDAQQCNTTQPADDALYPRGLSVHDLLLGNARRRRQHRFDFNGHIMN